MSLHQGLATPTKGEFGISYLATVAFALVGGLVGFAVVSRGSFVIVSIALFLALAVLGSVLYVWYAFRYVDVSDDLIWTVAQWTALGLALATSLSFVIGFGAGSVARSTLVANMLVLLVTTGGLIGTLLGVISSFRSQHVELDRLTQRNTVLNRVLRHNIKNDMNVILGHTELLYDAVPEDGAESVAAIERSATEVTRLSRTARHIDQLSDDAAGRRRIDVSATVRECADVATRRYPDADIHTDVNEPAWALAGPILRPVLLNLVENAVEHNDGNASVSLHVTADDGPEAGVTISVADDGPGIFAREREVLRADQEGPIRHGSGLGLWLVKWFADQYDGTLAFEVNEPRGTTVTLTLPAAARTPYRGIGARR